MTGSGEPNVVAVAGEQPLAYEPLELPDPSADGGLSDEKVVRGSGKVSGSPDLEKRAEQLRLDDKNLLLKMPIYFALFLVTRRVENFSFRWAEHHLEESQ